MFIERAKRIERKFECGFANIRKCLRSDSVGLLLVLCLFVFSIRYHIFVFAIHFVERTAQRRKNPASNYSPKATGF